MTKLSITLISAAVFLSGCATQQDSKNSAEQSTPAVPMCAASFVTEGSFLAGTKFSSTQEFPKKTVPGAFDSLLGAIATSGYQIVSSNKDSGLISANQTVSYGKGKTVPLNVFVKKLNTPGIRVEIVAQLSGGLSTSHEAVQKEFCKLMASVEQSSNAPEAQTPTSPAPANTAKQPKKSSKNTK